MNELDAKFYLEKNTHINEYGCWVTNTKTRSVRINGKMVTYSFLSWMLSTKDTNYSKSYRPLRVCKNKWCYNPTHLVFNELERLYLYSTIDKYTGCWNWEHAKDGGGYGIFVSTKYGKEKAHRISYKENFGEIPEGKFVCHKCDNPSCINPDHLFLGTNQENMNDKVSKNRQSRLNGNDNGRALLNIDKVKQIRNDYASGKYSYRTLVNKYGISQTQVARIIKKESWSWVSE